MQSSVQWLRKNSSIKLDIDDADIEKASDPPPESVYEPMSQIRRIVIHHSATETGCATAFRAYHRAVNGWVDIGYHFVIGNGSMSGNGEVETGRPEWAVGAHARKNNDDSIGICLVGDFTVTRPTEAQMESLECLLRELMNRYDLEKDDILLHRDLPECSTLCPGDNLTIEMVRELLKKYE